MTRDRLSAAACLEHAAVGSPRGPAAPEHPAPEVPAGGAGPAAGTGITPESITPESTTPVASRELGAVAINAGPTEPPALRAISAAAPGKASQENFPVALRLLPGRYRGHLLAVYAYARVVDDAGDCAPPEQRGELLTALADDVRRLYGAAAGSEGTPARLPAVCGLADVVTDCKLPIELLLDLIRANEQDQVITRYETFQELLGYCRLSANPVGRIVLHVFGCYSPQRAEMSDAICTGLQLAEHWQDVAEDMRAGRVYLPAADMRRYGCTEDDLRSARAPDRLRQLVAFEVRRAGDLISAGAPLIGTLRGWPRAAVAGYVAGGRAALAAIAAAGHDVLASTPHPSKGRTAAEMIAAFVRAR